MTRFPAEMLNQASGGDAVAINALLVLARPDVKRYARQKCRSASDVEDAVQETLFILFRHFNSLRRVESMSAWLFTIVYRQCLRLSATMLFAPVDIQAVDREGKLRATPNEEVRIDLANAIQSLPANYRDVILLRDVQEMTIDEIAAKLGATREGVKARLYSGNICLTKVKGYSMFASKTFIEHILRGAFGVVAIIFAIKLGTDSGIRAGIASLALGGAALIALRGCPICWTTGLVEMVAARVKR